MQNSQRTINCLDFSPTKKDCAAMQVIRKKKDLKRRLPTTTKLPFFLSCAGKMEEITKAELESIATELRLKITSVNINKGGIYQIYDKRRIFSRATP